MSEQRAYTPALGLAILTPLYDAAIATLTREAVWRYALICRAGLKIGERILDVGCGTGSLAVRLAQEAPGAEVVGIDPDPDVLRRARQKAERRGVDARFHEGFLSAAFLESQAPFDIITSSLVLHQVPLDGKADILAMIRKGLKPGGRVCIADYGLQRTQLMWSLFRRTVQALDGVVDTQPKCRRRSAGADEACRLCACRGARGIPNADRLNIALCGELNARRTPARAGVHEQSSALHPECDYCGCDCGAGAAGSPCAAAGGQRR